VDSWVHHNDAALEASSGQTHLTDTLKYLVEMQEACAAKAQAAAAHHVSATAACGVVWCGVVWCGVVWCGVVWCGVVWCGVVWCRRYPRGLWFSWRSLASVATRLACTRV
jgi:hypothetical protein